MNISIELTDKALAGLIRMGLLDKGNISEEKVTKAVNQAIRDNETRSQLCGYKYDFDAICTQDIDNVYDNIQCVRKQLYTIYTNDFKTYEVAGEQGIDKIDAELMANSFSLFSIDPEHLFTALLKAPRNVMRIFKEYCEGDRITA